MDTAKKLEWLIEREDARWAATQLRIEAHQLAMAAIVAGLTDPRDRSGVLDQMASLLRVAKGDGRYPVALVDEIQAIHDQITRRLQLP